MHSYSVTETTGGSDDPAFVQKMATLGVTIGPGCSNITVRNFRNRSVLGDGFVLCLTSQYSESMAQRFGNYCVEIFDATGFYAALNDAVQDVFPMAGGIGGAVMYGIRDGVDDVVPQGPLGFVKPKKYEDEMEFRLLWEHREERGYEPRVFQVPNAQRFCRRIR